MFQANKWSALLLPFDPDNNPVKLVLCSPLHRPDQSRPRERVSDQATVTEPVDAVEELGVAPVSLRLQAPVLAKG